MILIIGPLPDPIDGCSYANFVLCENLKKRKIHFKVINTNASKINGKQGQNFSLKKAFNFLKVYFNIFNIIWSKVVYITPGQTFYGVLKYSPFILLCIILNKPYVIHVHGNFLGSQYKQLSGVKRKIFYYLISRASAGIVLSKSLTNNFKGLLLPKKIFIVENFAGNDIYENSSNYEKNVDIPRIIYLSNLMEEKGILDLLDALIILDKKNINFNATIAGSIENSINDKVKKRFIKLGEKLDYIGVIQGQEKIKALMMANVFILPTYYKMEGQPISILEALATGNIIITTNHAGIPDIVSNKNGYIVEPKSPESIAKVILSINENLSEEVERCCSTNLKHALDNFTEDIFSDKILNIINLVAN